MGAAGAEPFTLSGWKFCRAAAVPALRFQEGGLTPALVQPLTPVRAGTTGKRVTAFLGSGENTQQPPGHGEKKVSFYASKHFF